MKFTNSMFNEIKSNLNNKDTVFKDILKFESGKTYLLRLVPNVNQPKKSIFHYFHHSWNSVATGKFVTAICPTTFGESCPLCSHAIKTYRSGSAEEKEKNKLISRKENWLTNVFVVSDATNADNVGKVKMLRYGRELAKIIDAAIDGDDASEFGNKIFDVQSGCSLRIKCEPRTNNAAQKHLVTYSSSKFVAPSTLDDVDDSRLAEVYKAIFDLEAVNKVPSAPELQRLLDQHYLCIEDASSSYSDDDDEIIEAPKPSLSKSSAMKTNRTPEFDVFSGVEDAKGSTKDDDDDDDDDLDAELKDILNKI